MKTNTIKIGEAVLLKFAARHGQKNISINPQTHCHEWLGAKNSAGYGYVKIDNRVIRVHRVTYALHYGEIKKGQVIMHKCDNRSCCNPVHLESGTQIENMRDMVSKGRGHWQNSQEALAAG